ncbi:MAG TPA: hypothetical protein VGU72_04440 [Beijerinckiaceae bacterium]|jgi:hypothetical protein|nr:hypothetical protein [Beijerinckiaceae bacterium]
MMERYRRWIEGAIRLTVFIAVGIGFNYLGLDRSIAFGLGSIFKAVILLALFGALLWVLFTDYFDEWSWSQKLTAIIAAALGLWILASPIIKPYDFARGLEHEETD